MLLRLLGLFSVSVGRNICLTLYLLVRQNVERGTHYLVDRLGILTVCTLIDEVISVPHTNYASTYTLLPPQIHNRSNTSILRQKPHKGEAESSLSQYFLCVLLREPLERFCAESFNEWLAQSIPIVLPEVQYFVTKRG